MNSLRDQFSAVSKAQVEAQFDFFNSMTAQALEGAGRLAALNMAVSRDAVQRSLGATCALMNSRDPRDVLVLGRQAEEQVRSLFAYSRELFGIASGMRPYAVRPQALPLTAPQAIETVEVVERSLAAAAGQAAGAAGEVPSGDSLASAAAPAGTSDEAVPAPPPVHAVAAFAPVTEPVVVAEPAPAPEPDALAAAAEPVPVAEPKPIVKAVGKGAARAAAAPHPAAAPLAAADAAEAPKVEMPTASPRRRK